MTTRQTIKIQLVECPECRLLLPELPDVPVYQCGGCGMFFLAQHCRNYLGNTELGLPGIDVADSSEPEHVSDDEESSGANQCLSLISEEKCRLDDDNMNTENELGDCSRDLLEVTKEVSSLAQVATCHEIVESPVVSQGDSEIVENDRFSASHGRPSTENTDATEFVGDHKISERGKIRVKGIMKRNIDMQNRVPTSFPTDKKHNTIKYRRLDSDVPLRPTGHGLRTRLCNKDDSTRMPFYLRNSKSVFENGSPSHQRHDKFHRNSRFCSPDNPEHEKIKLSKMVYELQKQLEKTHIAKVQAERRCIHIHCCNKVYNDQILKKRYTDSQFSLPCYNAIRCNDQRYRYYARNKFGTIEKQKHHRVKRHFQPVAGGAPFVTCYHCLTPLQLPADLLSFQSRCHKLKCGACSLVFDFSL